LRRLQERYVHRVLRELTVQVALKDLDYDWPSLRRHRRRKERVMKEAEKLIGKLERRMRAGNKTPSAPVSPAPDEP
jgi:hypothetical protein